jgi:hypothetical protein
MTSANEIGRINAVKAALISTTATPGWTYVKQIANKVVQKAIQDGLDELDRDKRDTLILKASSLQKGLADLFNYIEMTKNFNIDQINSDDNMLGELEQEQ